MSHLINHLVYTDLVLSTSNRLLNHQRPAIYYDPSEVLWATKGSIIAEERFCIEQRARSVNVYQIKNNKSASYSVQNYLRTMALVPKFCISHTSLFN